MTDRAPAPPIRPVTAALLLLAAAPALAGAQEREQELDVPYVPTPPEVVSQMLEMVEPTPSDTLYDLGSGDGRIVVTAAERYGTPGVGVELDSGRVATARQNAREAGVSELVRFVRGDLFEADLRPASIVTLYLFPGVNLKLRPTLFEQLEPGDRVVSHDFNMAEWSADSIVRMNQGEGQFGGSTVYFWVIPADVGGTWRLTLPGGDTVLMRLDQRFQELRATFPDHPGGQITGTRVRADTVRFTLRDVAGRGPLRFEGTLSDGRIEGTTAREESWSAEFVEDTDASILEWEGGGDG